MIITIPAVIVTLPAGMGAGTQIAVRHQDWGIEVDCRQRPQDVWRPIHHVGGTFEARP